MNSHCILYWIVKNWHSFKSILLFCFIKAIFLCLTMMVNLPCLKGSCPNFLRPTCSYTECSLSFLTGSCPTERTSANYSSCLYLILTDLCLHTRNWYSVDAFPHVSCCWSCGWCSAWHTSSLSGYFSPEPCSISDCSGTQQGSGFTMCF